MEILRVRNSQEGGRLAFDIVLKELESGGQVLGLATGSSPVELYHNLVKSTIDLSDVTSFNLDEYVGLREENPQSYHYFMDQHLFSKKTFKQSFLPSGLGEDLEQAAQDYENLLDDYGLDLQILGIGRNGHIGFNEPGTSFDSKTHVVDLEESTIEANARFFEDISHVPKQAISMGIASIMKAKTIILMAYGVEKADAIAKMVNGPVTEELPASILQEHHQVYVILDEAAASLL